MGNDIFLGQIDEELQRLQNELVSTKEAMQKAQGIFEQAKVKQERRVQELKAVDLMKQNLVGLSKKTASTEEATEEGLKQPPENYEEQE